MPKVVDHNQRRTEFAMAVWALIASRGIEGVTLRSVAAEAGVSVGRVQHYYASREELVRDSCRVLLEMSADRFDERTQDASAEERLRTLVLRTIPTDEPFAVGTSVWLAYQAKSVDDPVLAELVSEGHHGNVAEAAGLLTSLGAANAEASALDLMALAEGLALRVLVGSLDAASAQQALERALERSLPRA